MSFQPEEGFEVPLFDTGAERATLGAMFLSADVAQDVTAIVEAEDFHRPAHRTIFGAMAGLLAVGKDIDVVNMETALSDRGELERIGGPDYLSALFVECPSAGAGCSYAGTVRDKGMLRRFIAETESLRTEAMRGISMDVLLERVRTLPSEMQAGSDMDAHVDVRRLLRDEETWTEVAVVSSGNAHLDALAEGGGLACGQFSLSTAPSGEGKTTWALGVMFAALERGERCAYLSFTDLGRRHVLAKAIRYLTGLSGTAACRTDADRRAVADAKERIYESWDWEIYDAQSSPGAQYVETAVAWLDRIQRQGLARRDGDRFPRRPVRLSVWDYAQAIFSSDERFTKGKGGGKYQEQMHVAHVYRRSVARIDTAHSIMCAQLTDDKKEWIRDCKEWEFGSEFCFRIKKEGVAIKKRRFGGKTDAIAPHDHHPRRQTFVSDGGAWDPLFDPYRGGTLL